MLRTSLLPRLVVRPSNVLYFSTATVSAPKLSRVELPIRCGQSINLASAAVPQGMRAPTGVSLPSLYDGSNRRQQLGPRGSESFFVNKQGLKIATYFWPSEAASNSKAVVIAVHGHGAHSQNEWLKRQVSSAFCVLHCFCRPRLPTYT